MTELGITIKPLSLSTYSCIFATKKKKNYTSIVIIGKYMDVIIWCIYWPQYVRQQVIF